MLRRNVGTAALINLVSVIALLSGLVLWLSADQSSNNKELSNIITAKTYIGVVSVIRTTDRWPQTLLVIQEQSPSSIHRFNCNAVIDSCRTLGPLPFDGYVKANDETPIEVGSHAKGILISESMQSAHAHERSKGVHNTQSLGKWLMGLGATTLALCSLLCTGRTHSN